MEGTALALVLVNGRSLHQNAWLLNLAKFLGPFWPQECYQEAIGYLVFNT